MLLRDPIPRLDARLDPLPLEPSAWQRSPLKAQSHVLAVRRPMANPDAAVATYVVHDVLRYVLCMAHQTHNIYVYMHKRCICGSNCKHGKNSFTDVAYAINR